MNEPKKPEGPTISPLGLTATIWCVVIGLTLYGASHVRDELTKAEDLSEVEVLGDAVTAAMKIADATGLSALEATLRKAREAINEPYTVLNAESVDVEPPPPPPPVVAPPTNDDLAHEVAPRKHRVLVIGASSIQFAIGVVFEKTLPTYAGVRVKRFGQLATGLSRPDFMDWPKKLESLASAFKPDLVITNFGGNDAQAIPIGKYDKVEFGTAEWDKTYGERVKEIVRIGKKHGAQTVMLGMPVMRKTVFNAKIHRLNRVMKQAVEEEGQLFISTFEMASTPSGEYRPTINFNGKRGLMRMSDGIHYTRLGAEFIVEQVMQEIERNFVFELPGEGLARAEKHTFVSRLASAPRSYVAYVPTDSKDANAAAATPAVLVLPEREWSAWPNHPHRELQAAANTNGVVLIVPNFDVGDTDIVMTELLPDVALHVTAAEPVGLLVGTDTATAASAMIAADADAFGSVSFATAPASTPTGVRTLVVDADHPTLSKVVGWHAAKN